MTQIPDPNAQPWPNAAQPANPPYRPYPPVEPTEPIPLAAYPAADVPLFGFGEGQPVAPQPDRAPRRRRGLVAAVAATALVAGGVGGVVGTALATDDSGALGLRSGNGATAVTSTSTGTGSVAAAASTIMPSTVVIEVTGSNGRLGAQTGGSGSGVVLDTDGNILTNAHVVTAGGSVSNPTIVVTFNDGQSVEATVVGIDESSDLAVIKVAGVDDLTPATFADSDQLQIGQVVVAVGAPLGLSGTVTEGIVSAVDRPVRTGSSQDVSTVLDAVQTDAAINPGNSGGPLVDLAGSVVGINSAIATVSGASGQSGNIGVGFAIPSNDARNIADQLIIDGNAEHAALGVSASETENRSGARIRSVEPGSAAADAGLQDGDIVTAVGERAVRDLDSLLAAIRDYQPGDTVTLSILRDGSKETLTVTLGSRAG
jgi:putative serine protease PepD